MRSGGGLVDVLLPGLVFQAVVVGAGYATGRELVQFFMSGSLSAGLLGMLVTAVTWGLALAIAFEIARYERATDYRTFVRSLIGPLWPLYELCFVALLVLVISVLASAAGEIASSRAGWPSSAGSLVMMAGVAALVFFGTEVVERFLAAWSMLLYVLFALILAICLVRYGESVFGALLGSPPSEGWAAQGVSYAGYNLAVVPGILYCTRRLQSTRQALTAGALAGVIAIVPAMFFFCAMAAFWPEIRSAPVPIDLVLERLDLPWLSAIFYIALFGIFVKTGAALIHAVNERIAGALQERGLSLPSWSRPVVAIGVIAIAAVLADRIGIVALIAKGYQMLTSAFLLVFVAPLVIVGGLRIVRRGGGEATTVPKETRLSE
jgi:uncharacterized membrane protein YkvI